MISTQGAVWITVPGKSGYRALTDVTILDNKGMFFYGTKKGERFNLPKGYFAVKGSIEPLAVPIDYDLPIYPFDRDDRPYTSVIVTVLENPHKASVLFQNGIAKIFLDRSIEAMPLACYCYICSHELAHSHYSGEGDELENKCDEYGEKRLLDLGWNPRQLKAANKILLNGGWRKSQCEKRMVKHFAKK